MEQDAANGSVDAQDRLVDADPPLLDLHRRCGGELGSTIAIPELLALVSEARTSGQHLSRRFSAQDGENRISARADISPHDDGRAGAHIRVSDWDSRPLDRQPEENALAMVREIDRNIAECAMRLDGDQCVLSFEVDAPDLEHLARSTRSQIGQHWTQLVRLSVDDAEHTHWRMLDGATCGIEGSSRQWTAHLDPLDEARSGVSGFVLYLTADTLLPVEDEGEEAEPAYSASLGRDLTPVLRQPVDRIIANAETIRSKLAGPLSDNYSAYAEDIADAGQHLLGLMDDLSDLEVVEAETFSTAPDRIDLADVARRACGILGVRAQEKNVTLIPPGDGESQMAIAEFRRVLQILLNLVGNAIRYGPEDSQIWIRLDGIGDQAMVTVADQGHGLDEAQQERVFEKFERLGRSGDNGSGLGLYISRRIARAMDGDLTVESAPGQGARFTLSVPADA